MSKWFVTIESAGEPLHPASGSFLRRISLKSYLLLAVFCLFALLFAVLSLVKRNIRNQVAAEMSKIKERGEPMFFEHLAQAYTSGLSNGNAADALQQAFILLPAGAADECSKIITEYKESDRRLDAKTIEKLASSLREHQKAFDALAPAFLHDRAAFPLSWSSGYSMLLPHLAKMKSVAVLLHARAILHTEEGRSAETLNDIIQIFQLGGFLEHESIVVSQFVRFAICSYGFEALQSALNKIEFTPGEINRLQQAILSAQKSDPFTQSLMAERVLGVEYLMAPEKIQGVVSVPAFGLRVYKASGLLAYEQKIYFRALAQMIDASREPFPEALDRAAAVQASFMTPPEEPKTAFFKIPPRGFLSAMLLPGISNALNKQGATMAQSRLAYIALELEKCRDEKGSYPPSLNDLQERVDSTQLLDPFNGWSLRYSTLGNGFDLYSVGPDRTDDGGLPRASDKQGPKGLLVTNREVPKDHYDILFRVKRASGGPSR